MRPTLTLACWLALAAALPAQSVTVPDKVSVPGPGLVVVRPTALDADDCCWTSLDAGLALIPSDLLAKKEAAVGYASAPGVYRLRVVAAKAVGGKAVLSAPADVVVTVGNPAPPTPPTPPVPTDPLAASFQAAYLADGADAASLAFLAAAFDAMSQAAPGLPYRTSTEWLAYVDAVVSRSATNPRGLSPDRLPRLRAAIGSQLGLDWPGGVPVPPADASRELSRIAAALKAVSEQGKGVRP